MYSIRYVVVPRMNVSPLRLLSTIFLSI